MIERIGPVAYRLALPLELSQIHSVFHVSQLRRYRSKPSHILQQQPIELQPDLTYEEEPSQILGREVRQLRSRQIPMVKIQPDLYEFWLVRNIFVFRYTKSFETMNDFLS